MTPCGCGPGHEPARLETSGMQRSGRAEAEAEPPTFRRHPAVRRGVLLVDLCPDLILPRTIRTASVIPVGVSMPATADAQPQRISKHWELGPGAASPAGRTPEHVQLGAPSAAQSWPNAGPSAKSLRPFRRIEHRDRLAPSTQPRQPPGQPPAGPGPRLLEVPHGRHAPPCSSWTVR